MPAIRCHHNFSSFIASANYSEYPIPIRMKDGKLTGLPWCGFVCEKGLEHMHYDRKLKIAAGQITNGLGFLGDHWELVDLKSEYVLGVRCIQDPAKCTYGVMAVVDVHGWPIVYDKNSRRPMCRTLKAV